MDITNTTPEYLEGWQAFLDGKLAKDCPYPENSTQSVDWQLGRLDAQLKYSR